MHQQTRTMGFSACTFAKISAAEADKLTSLYNLYNSNIPNVNGSGHLVI